MFDLEFDFSSIARFDGLFSTDFLPSEMSADTLLIIIMLVVLVMKMAVVVVITTIMLLVLAMSMVMNRLTWL